MNWQTTAQWESGGYDARATSADLSLAANPPKLIWIFERWGLWKDWWADWDPTNEEQSDAHGAVVGSQFWLSLPGPHSKGINILFADSHVKWFKSWNREAMTFNIGKS